MKLISATLAILLMLAAPRAVQAQAIDGGQCKDLFAKTYNTKAFVISIEGKKQSKQFLAKAHDNLVANGDPLQVNSVLQTIADEGFASLSEQQRNFIINFRQNSSFLRSIFQTSDKDHSSPNKFANFVKDFGILKDLLAINDDIEAQKLAVKILKKYSDLDFNKLIKKMTPASKKSVAKYFSAILADSKAIMQKQAMTIDEVHDVRKNLRDVLRYLQIEKEVLEEKNEAVPREKEKAIAFLKKINTRLGFICDEYAGLILQDKDSDSFTRMTKKTLVEFPADLRPRVEHFLNSYTIVIVHSQDETAATP